MTCTAQTPACWLGSYYSAAANATSDRTCTACSPGTFASAAAASTPQSQVANACPFVQSSSCPAGTFLSASSTSTADRVCSTCPAGSFSVSSSVSSFGSPVALTCVSQQNTTCPSGTYYSATSTPVSDRICTACAVGTFSPTNTTSALNAALATGCPMAQSTTCASGTFYSAPASATADRVCTACAAGSFSAASTPSPVPAAACYTTYLCAWITNGDTQYLGASNSNRGAAYAGQDLSAAQAACSANAACGGVGLSVSESPFAGNDGTGKTYYYFMNKNLVVNPVFSCNGAVYVKGGCGGAATGCPAQSPTCPAGTYYSAPATAVSDRTCTPCGPATYSANATASTFATTVASACLPQSPNCAAGTYYSAQSTPTLDRTCTVCASNTFSASSTPSQLSAISVNRAVSSTASCSVSPGVTVDSCLFAMDNLYDDFELSLGNASTPLSLAWMQFDFGAPVVVDHISLFGYTGFGFVLDGSSLYVGNSPTYANNTKCPGGPYTVSTATLAMAQAQGVVPALPNAISVACPLTGRYVQLLSSSFMLLVAEMQVWAPSFATPLSASCASQSPVCQAGTYYSAPATATADRVCTPCAEGTYSRTTTPSTAATAVSTGCTPQTATCDAGFYYSAAASATKDRACTACAPFTFSAGATSSTYGTVVSKACQPQTYSCAAGSFYAAPAAIACAATILQNTSTCYNMTGETSFTIASSVTDAAAACSAACCALNNANASASLACSAWTVRPWTESNSTLKRCWLKPAGCARSFTHVGATSGFVSGSTTDRVCTTCGPGTFSASSTPSTIAAPTVSACAPQSASCGLGTYYSAAALPATDRTCTQCTALTVATTSSSSTASTALATSCAPQSSQCAAGTF